MASIARTGDSIGSGTLMLHLLGRCNLKCLHCYMEGAPSRKEELSLTSVLRAIAESRQLGIGIIYLTGGEPLLYRGLSEVLEAAHAQGVEVRLCTNGMLITEQWAARLQSLAVKANVSVDGEATFHDSFRKLSGAFCATERGVRRLKAVGVPVTIVTTISQGNLESLPRIAQWAAEAGAAELRVQPLLKLGRGAEIAEQRLTSAQMNRMLLQLSDLATTYKPRGMTCSINGVTRRFLQAHPCGAYVCNGGGCDRRVAKEIKKIVIREDGTVLPEITNLSHRFALGNIHHDGSLSMLVKQYFDSGYDEFDQLCRNTYTEVLPVWDGPIVPWDQIVAERSLEWTKHPLNERGLASCGVCSTESIH